MENYIGKSFDRLKVIGIEDSKYYFTKEGYKKERKRLKVLCFCGNKKVVDLNNLKNGNTKSCGCLKEEKFPIVRRIGHRNREVKFSPIKRQFRNYKYTAKRKNIKFEISFEQFLELVLKDCTYCGVEPSLKVTNENNTKFNIINGVDRKDSSKGYIKGNITTCCSQCNYAKREMSVEEFLNFIKRVNNFQLIKNEKENK